MGVGDSWGRSFFVIPNLGKEPGSGCGRETINKSSSQRKLPKFKMFFLPPERTPWSPRLLAYIAFRTGQSFSTSSGQPCTLPPPTKFKVSFRPSSACPASRLLPAAPIPDLLGGTCGAWSRSRCLSGLGGTYFPSWGRPASSGEEGWRSGGY